MWLCFWWGVVVFVWCVGGVVGGGGGGGCVGGWGVCGVVFVVLWMEDFYLLPMAGPGGYGRQVAPSSQCSVTFMEVYGVPHLDLSQDSIIPLSVELWAAL